MLIFLTVYIRRETDAMDIYIPTMERLICSMQNMSLTADRLKKAAAVRPARYSRAYIRHLLKAKEMLGMRLCVLHNLYFYNTMMTEIRDALDAGRFAEYKRHKLDSMATPLE